MPVERTVLDTSALELRFKLTDAPPTPDPYQDVVVLPEVAVLLGRPTDGDWELSYVTIHGRAQTGTKRQGRKDSITFVDPLGRDTQAPDWIIDLVADWRQALDLPDNA